MTEKNRKSYLHACKSASGVSAAREPKDEDLVPNLVYIHIRHNVHPKILYKRTVLHEKLVATYVPVSNILHNKCLTYP